MPRTSILFLSLLLITTAGFAQTASPDSQITQNLLNEVRQLRQDLQATAGSIQRVQIIMYRLQSATASLERVTQRLESARNWCQAIQNQRKMAASEIEQAEARLRKAQSPSDQKTAEEFLARLKASREISASEEQQCQAGQIDAESQLHAEQAKMNDLEAQLNRLDKVLAGDGRK